MPKPKKKTDCIRLWWKGMWTRTTRVACDSRHMQHTPVGHTKDYRLGAGTKHIVVCLGARTRFFGRCLRKRTRTSARCLGARTTTSIFRGMGTTVFLRLQYRAIQVIVRFSQQFEEHALGCLDHTLICFTGDIAGLQVIGQSTSAFVEVPESFRQFAESSLFRIRYHRNVRGTRRCQTLASFTTPTEAFRSWSLPMLCH